MSAAFQPPLHSSTRCAPLLRVTEVPALASSSRRTSSIHGPVAFTTSARRDVQRLAGEGVAHLSDRATLEPDQLDSVEHDGARVGCTADVRQAEPGVVGLGVGIQPRGTETLAPQLRNELRRGRGRDHAAALGDGSGQPRVRPERATDRDARVGPAAIDGEHEAERTDEVGCHEPAERLHLGQRLANQAELAEPQVAQPAVDQLRRRARRGAARSRRARRARP